MDWRERDWRDGLAALSAAHAFEDSVLGAHAESESTLETRGSSDKRAVWDGERLRDEVESASPAIVSMSSHTRTPEWPWTRGQGLPYGPSHERAPELSRWDQRERSDERLHGTSHEPLHAPLHESPHEQVHEQVHEQAHVCPPHLAVTDERVQRGPVEVHLAIYEHRFGLDVSVHATAELAMAALTDTATAQCARDPAIRSAVCERFGRWPACGFTERELEELLEAWSDLSDGERLWTTECVVHGFDATRLLGSPGPSGVDAGNRPVSAVAEGTASPESDFPWNAAGESIDADEHLRAQADVDREACPMTRDLFAAKDSTVVAASLLLLEGRKESASRPDAGLRTVPVVAPTDHTMPYDILDAVYDFERRVSER